MADSVMEERNELMVSPISGDVHFRRAHFLKPSADGPVAAPSFDRSAGGSCKDYAAWGRPSPKWLTWVDEMSSSHHSTWQRAGILDAIMSSTYCIHRCEDLILGLVEKWSPTTNSFVFPWGEATVTLEDMMALGAYSVLGESVLTPPVDADMEEKVSELLAYRLELNSSRSKKAYLGMWMAKFMGSGSQVEHEAFLVYWLSKFVFPLLSQAIGKSVVPIAVHLARGTRIALAPAVLASIYRGLTLFKEGTAKPVKAPLALIQIWAWERFTRLRPNRVSGPRMARWDGVVCSMSIDSGFEWRPYAAGDVNMDVESFVRCVRRSKLVGLEDCVEQYLPHRVAMQLGMDQDLPAAAAGDDAEAVDYSRPVGDAQIYVPPRVYQPCVSSRYLEWWKKVSDGKVEEEAGHSTTAFKRTKRRYLEQFRRQRNVNHTCCAPKSSEAFGNEERNHQVAFENEEGNHEPKLTEAFASEEGNYGDVVTQATIEEEINLSVRGREEMVRNLEHLVRLLEAGKLVCFPGKAQKQSRLV